VLYISTLGGSILTLCSTSPDSACPIPIEPGDNFRGLRISAPDAVGRFVRYRRRFGNSTREWLDNQPMRLHLMFTRVTYSILASRQRQLAIRCDGTLLARPKPGGVSNQSAGHEVAATACGIAEHDDRTQTLVRANNSPILGDQLLGAIEYAIYPDRAAAWAERLTVSHFGKLFFWRLSDNLNQQR